MGKKRRKAQGAGLKVNQNLKIVDSGVTLE
jgi:hypothetical protein